MDIEALAPFNYVRERGGITVTGIKDRERCYVVNIPEGVTSVGESAFSYCSSLSKLTLPSTLTQLGKFVVEGCGSLTEIHFAGTKKQWRKVNKHKENRALKKKKIICDGGK